MPTHAFYAGNKINLWPLSVYAILVYNAFAIYLAERTMFVVWEWLSSTYGRKVTIQIGIVGLTVSTMALGVPDTLHAIVGCFLTSIVGIVAAGIASRRI